jgi:hypothetical protein
LKRHCLFEAPSAEAVRLMAGQPPCERIVETIHVTAGAPDPAHGSSP